MNKKQQSKPWLKNTQTACLEAPDMPGIDPQIMSHKLNIYPDAKPVKQKKRMYGAEKGEATRSEVGKLMEAKICKGGSLPRVAS